MALPTGNDVQLVEPVLTNMMVSYMQAQERFVADRVFPGVPVRNDSGTYGIFTKKYWFSDQMEQRAYGTQYARGGFGVSSSTFTTLQWALSKAIADEERANNQFPMELESAAVEWLAQQALIRKERAWAADFMKTSVWATDNTSATAWSDYSGSDPVGDVRTAKRTISQSTGKAPNVMVMGEIVEDRLMNHPDLIDRIKYTQVATAGTVLSAMAALFGLEEILVGMAIYNSANEGQTESMGAIIDDDALVLYRNPTPSLKKPSAGYTFYWEPGGGLGGILPIVRLDEEDSDLVKTKMQWDQAVVATDLGYFFSDVTD